ncbi:D-glycerate 3-kinase, chloroplastic [Vitis vinifera]|uniref:D-glycerate 3-kinase, chloroplastic n=1 Tax=Vitis vinifera TaxID=29760 RepID=A0A438GZG3_VITVI|nr:D-glycerate 3-kinase, chloroplastic [Vitis vinifera]
MGHGSSWMQEKSMCCDTNANNGRRQGPLYSALPKTPAEVSSVQDLFEFICSGPLMDKLGLTKKCVAESIDKWLAYGSYLSRLFQLNELYLTIPQKARLVLVHHKVVGRTTLVFALKSFFNMTGRKTATISIDDFYLTAEGQAKLREENPGNALLESAYKGKGDRADPSTWPEVEGPLTAVLFEGWMLGFKPLPAEFVKSVDPQLETVNKNLEAYYDAWDKFIKVWIVIKIKDPTASMNGDCRLATALGILSQQLYVLFLSKNSYSISPTSLTIHAKNLQAEIAMRAEGNPECLMRRCVQDFVSRYLPAYNAYLPTLYSEGPNGSDLKRLLVIEIDEGRNPFS